MSDRHSGLLSSREKNQLECIGHTSKALRKDPKEKFYDLAFRQTIVSYNDVSLVVVLYIYIYILLNELSVKLCLNGKIRNCERKFMIENVIEDYFYQITKKFYGRI